jgi:hypothetical protein
MKKLIGFISSAIALTVTALVLTGCSCDRNPCCDPCPRPCAPKPCCPKPCPRPCCPVPCAPQPCEPMCY